MADNLIRGKQLNQGDLDQIIANYIASANLSILTGNFDKIYATNLVYNTGNQPISGNKTFSNQIIFGNENGRGGSISGSTVGGDSRLFITADGPGAEYIYLNAGPASISLGEGGVNISNGNNPLYFNGTDDIIINNTRSLSANAITASFLGASFFNRPTVNGSGVLLVGEAAGLPDSIVYATGNQVINGFKSFVNNTQFSGSGIFNSGISLNNINNLSLSGVNVTVSDANVVVQINNSQYIPLGNNPLSVVGSGNSYIQLNIQNKASGTAASADLVITANAGSDSTNYIDLGINNSGYNQAEYSIGSSGDAYLYNNGGNLTIGTQTTGKVIKFHAGGTTAADQVALINRSGILSSQGITAYQNSFFGKNVNITGNLYLGVSGYNASTINIATDVSDPFFIRNWYNSYKTISWQDAELIFTDKNTQVFTVGFDYPYSNEMYLFFDFASGSPNARYTTLSIPKNKTGYIALNQELVHNSGNEIIFGNKTFVNNLQVSGSGIFDAVDLNNIDIISLSGTDVTITNGNVFLTNPLSAPNVVFNTGNQNISGIKTFINSGVFSLSGAAALGLPNNPLSVVGSGNTYLQINIQNRATGTSATADLVITANNGTDNSNYINLGINNSGYNDQTFSNGSGLDGYLYINGGNLDIGTQTAGKNIEFHAGGATLKNVIARIDESGFNLVSGNLTVGGTGVLLSGQNSFIITLYNTSDTQAAGHNYFGNMANSMNGAADGANRRFPVLESCTVRRASWTQINTTAGNPSLNSTGYFINTTTSKTGIISTTINTQSTTAPNHYTAEFSPPIAISTGDYIVCSLFSPTYATTFPAGQRNTVNIYCYN
jgi:hypothetical protein